MKILFRAKSLFPAALFILAIFTSCIDDKAEQIQLNDLDVLSPDSGGEHLAEVLDPAKNIYGHYT